MREWRSKRSRRRCARSSEQDRGFYTVLFAIMLPLLIGALGFAIDMSHWWWAQSQVQNAADAAALAGSKDLNSTSAGRTRATTDASSLAKQNKIDGVLVSAADITENVTGKWDFKTNSFVTSNVTDASANALRVTVQRKGVQSFFSKLLPGAKTSQTLVASATAAAGGARSVGCAAPVAIAACILTYDASGKLNCPTNLSFQNATLSIGLTLPDGSSPVTGKRAEPYFGAILADPNGCEYGAGIGDTLNLQNGNDLSQATVNAINLATNNGATPISVTMPVMDMTCSGGNATYNQSAVVVGFMKMKIVGAVWTGNAPAAVQAACPTLGNKNICVAGDCSMIDSAPAGGTINVSPVKTYLVH